VKPRVRCATLNGYVGLARSVGIDPDPVLRGVGLNPADLTVPDKWVPASDVARALDVSARESHHPDFGLKLAELRRLSTLGPISVVLREEPDLRSALDLLTRYQQSYNEALHMQVTEADGLATARLWFEFGEPAPSRQALELATAVLYGIMRAFLGADWHPLSVCFSHKAPADLETHRQTFGARLQFEHEFTGMVFFAKDLDAPNAMSDPMLRAYTQKFLQSLPTPGNATTIERVKELVEMLLPLGRCSMDHIARTLDVDPRTLRRHLADQQQSFSGILHDTRARMAERYMHNDRYSLTDISQQLGFAAPSAFTRWFRQQFGSSPQEWRRAAAR
jgi:AraC-like DNA-binding protein